MAVKRVPTIEQNPAHDNIRRIHAKFFALFCPVYRVLNVTNCDALSYFSDIVGLISIYLGNARDREHLHGGIIAYERLHFISPLGLYPVSLNTIYRFRLSLSIVFYKFLKYFLYSNIVPRFTPFLREFAL